MNSKLKEQQWNKFARVFWLLSQGKDTNFTLQYKQLKLENFILIPRPKGSECKLPTSVAGEHFCNDLEPEENFW